MADTTLSGRYLWPVEVEGGWTTGLFSVDGDLIDEFGYWKTRKDALYGCRILKDEWPGCQVPS